MERWAKFADYLDHADIADQVGFADALWQDGNSMELSKAVVNWIKCRKDLARPYVVGLTVVVLGGAVIWWAIAAWSRAKSDGLPVLPRHLRPNRRGRSGSPPRCQDIPDGQGDRRASPTRAYPVAQNYEFAQQTGQVAGRGIHSAGFGASLSVQPGPIRRSSGRPGGTRARRTLWRPPAAGQLRRTR